MRKKMKKDKKGEYWEGRNQKINNTGRKREKRRKEIRNKQKRVEKKTGKGLMRSEKKINK